VSFAVAKSRSPNNPATLPECGRGFAIIMLLNQNDSVSTKKTERDRAISSLREVLQPGAVIYTVLRSVSASGM